MVKVGDKILITDDITKYNEGKVGIVTRVGYSENWKYLVHIEGKTSVSLEYSISSKSGFAVNGIPNSSLARILE